MNDKSSNSSKWSSNLSYVLATSGAAIGLGSIWRFPYLLGENGGSVFLLTFLLTFFLCAIPLLFAETFLGKLAKSNAVNGLENLASTYNFSKAWKYLGYLGALSMLLVMSFYSVISSWSLAYIFKSVSGALHELNASSSTELLNNFLSSPFRLSMWHGIYMTITMLIIVQGMQKGVERFCKILMPIFFLLLILLLIYSLTVGDVKEAANFLLRIDFQSGFKLSVVLQALGQALFSLAVGAGCMFLYGSYLPESSKVTKQAFISAMLTLFVSLTSGFTIYPLIFKYGLPVDSGPSLMFRVFPVAFSDMPFGQLVGILFFVLLFFAALTSSLSLAEPIASIFEHRFKFQRKSIVVVLGLISWLIGIVCLLSFNLFPEDVAFSRNIFDLVADLTTNILLPVGALGYAFIFGYKIPKHVIVQGIGNNKILNKLVIVSVKYLVPLVILISFI